MSANPEHVALVRKGRATIEEWKKLHPNEPLDLSESNLSRVGLSLANLDEAKLSGANLSEANLS